VYFEEFAVIIPGAGLAWERVGTRLEPCEGKEEETMGAWGVSPFENDNALDWVWNLEEAEDTSVLSDALDAVAAAEEIVEDCEEAIAAAEVVAALLGRAVADLPDEVTEFVKKHGKKKPSPKLVKLAAAVVRRISKASDLKERWDESESAKEWQKTMKDLLKRLGE